jgi:hypothetical protein
MIIAVPEQQRRSRTSPPEPNEISRLAETFQDAIQPVWIHDPSGLCLFCNRLAEKRDPRGATIVFDLLDHEGRLFARMSTVEA